MLIFVYDCIAIVIIRCVWVSWTNGCSYWPITLTGVWPAMAAITILYHRSLSTLKAVKLVPLPTCRQPASLETVQLQKVMLYKTSLCVIFANDLKYANNDGSLLLFSQSAHSERVVVTARGSVVCVRGSRTCQVTGAGGWEEIKHKMVTMANVRVKSRKCSALNVILPA